MKRIKIIDVWGADENATKMAESREDCFELWGYKGVKCYDEYSEDTDCIGFLDSDSRGENDYPCIQVYRSMDRIKVL